MITESVEALIHGIDVKDNHILTISLLALLVNIVSFKYSHSIYTHGCHGHIGHSCSHEHNVNNTKDNHNHELSTHEHSHDNCTNTLENTKYDDKHDHQDGHDHEHLHHHQADHDHKDRHELNIKHDCEQSNGIKRSGSIENQIDPCSNEQNGKEAAAIKNMGVIAELLKSNTEIDARQQNLRSMMIHMFFDILSSVIVVFSCFMVKFFRFNYFDPICSILTSVILLSTTFNITQSILHNFKSQSYDFRVLFGDHELSYRMNCLLNRRSILLKENGKKSLYVDIQKCFLDKTMKNSDRDKFCHLYHVDDVVFSLD